MVRKFMTVRLSSLSYLEGLTSFTSTLSHTLCLFSKGTCRFTAFPNVSEWLFCNFQVKFRAKLSDLQETKQVNNRQCNCIGFYSNQPHFLIHYRNYRAVNIKPARRAGSEGNMSASGSAGPGFDPRRGVVNFNLKIFNLGARRGGDVHFLIAILYIIVLD